MTRQVRFSDRSLGEDVAFYADAAPKGIVPMPHPRITMSICAEKTRAATRGKWETAFILKEVYLSP